MLPHHLGVMHPTEIGPYLKDLKGTRAAGRADKPPRSFHIVDVSMAIAAERYGSLAPPEDDRATLSVGCTGCPNRIPRMNSQV